MSTKMSDIVTAGHLAAPIAKDDKIYVVQAGTGDIVLAGTALQLRAFTSRFQPPKAADFGTLVGTVHPTLTDDDDVGLMVNCGAVATGDANRFAYKALPGGDFDVSIHMNATLTLTSFNAMGLMLLESATNKLMIVGSEWGSAAANYRVGRLTSPTGFVSNPADPGQGGTGFEWFRIQQTGSTLNFYMSKDGKSWLLIYTEALTAFFTTAPDSIGLGFSINMSSGANPQFSVDYWNQDF
jgi:hypothetical protein